jgi:hypothetical protein
MRIKYQGGSNSQGHGAQKKAVWAEAQENGRQNQAEWIAQRSDVEGGAGCWVLGSGVSQVVRVMWSCVVSCRVAGPVESGRILKNQHARNIWGGDRDLFEEERPPTEGAREDPCQCCTQ